MARLIPASERIIKARALIQKARDVLPPAEAVVLDLSYMAEIKDILQQARDLIKFIPYTPSATPEMKSQVAELFKEAELAEKELLHRH
jgi:hypothetical protein